MKLPVLMYQMDVEFGKPKVNMTKLTDMLDKHRPDAGTLVIVPELFLTGYHAGAIADLTETDDSSYLKKLLKVSEKYQIKVFGSIPMSHDGDPFNTAILLENGEVIDTYQKSHLFGPMGEKELFRPGRDVKLSKLGDTVVGMSICYDLRFPELYQQQVKQGAELLLICAEWPIQRINHWSALARARAIENQCVVVACNRVGDDPDYHYGGHSVIYNSYGEIVIEAEHDKEVVLKSELQLEELTGFRSNFETAIDRWI